MAVAGLACALLAFVVLIAIVASSEMNLNNKKHKKLQDEINMLNSDTYNMKRRIQDLEGLIKLERILRENRENK